MPSTRYLGCILNQRKIKSKRCYIKICFETFQEGQDSSFKYPTKEGNHHDKQLKRIVFHALFLVEIIFP
jgi:hypothetical protein